MLTLLFLIVDWYDIDQLKCLLKIKGKMTFLVTKKYRWTTLLLFHCMESSWFIYLWWRHVLGLAYLLTLDPFPLQNLSIWYSRCYFQCRFQASQVIHKYDLNHCRPLMNHHHCIHPFPLLAHLVPQQMGWDPDFTVSDIHTPYRLKM